jgi:hypothetical protein
MRVVSGSGLVVSAYRVRFARSRDAVSMCRRLGVMRCYDGFRAAGWTPVVDLVRSRTKLKLKSTPLGEDDDNGIHWYAEMNEIYC